MGSKDTGALRPRKAKNYMNLIELLVPYLVRVAPGMLVLSVAFAALRPGKAARSIFYIAAFVLLRDAMTPLGHWLLVPAALAHGGAIFLLSSGLI